MDQSRGSYLLCFPDFPCKSFKLKDFGPPAPYLVDSKRSRRRGGGGRGVLFMFYDVHIPRCTHIKTNGTQCGCPALRERRFCYFHEKWQGQQIALKAEQPSEPLTFTMPLLEDGDSVQIALMQIIRLIAAGQLEPKTARLLLSALQAASLNLR